MMFNKACSFILSNIVVIVPVKTAFLCGLGSHKLTAKRNEPRNPKHVAHVSI